jgi:hypothetical protein
VNFRRLFGAGRPMEDETEAILGRHLDGDFIVFPMAGGSASMAQIGRIASRLGVRYPPEFMAHVCGRFPGVHVEVKEAVWPRPKPYDVAPFWSFLYGLHTYTSVPESEPWMRLDAAAEELRNDTGLKAAPILKVVGDADVYCASPSGAIVRFRHETEELEPVKLGFWQLLEEEIRELRARKDKKRAGS